MYISGIFNGETTSPSHRAKIPATYGIIVSNSKPIGVLLDVRQGSYHRRGYISDSQGGWYELRWFAHRQERGLYVLEIDVHNDAQENLSVQLNNPFFYGTFASEDITFENNGGMVGGAICGQTTIPETTGGPTHTVCLAETAPLPASVQVASSQAFRTFRFVTAYRTSLDVSSPASASPQEVTEAVRTAALADASKANTATSLYSTHTAGWAELWATSSVHIEGRLDVAQAVNASLFAVLSSVRDDWPYGLAPGGLTNYYNGHAFWDTETWMYPALLVLQPKIAHSLVQYRYDRLAGAHLKAASYSPPFAGAMFPWESAFSGVETCPIWAATGQREDHISGDIALAIWQYWLISQDKVFLSQIAYPILSDIADFWNSRAVYQVNAVTQRSEAHILDIIPPDEYVDHVDDSVYSNAVASLALDFFVQAHALLFPSTKNDSRVAKYAQLARDLVILFNETLQIHPEYANYAGQVVKQADVVLLRYPLGVPMNTTIHKNDLDYYAARTDTHGPAMTWGMQCIGYLDLHEWEIASGFFNRSFQDNMHAPFHVWTETPDGNAVNFITGAGGFLQTIVQGYLGLRIVHHSHFDEDASRASLSMPRPEHWEFVVEFSPQCMEQASLLEVHGVHVRRETFSMAVTCDPANHSVKNVSVKRTSPVADEQSPPLLLVQPRHQSAQSGKRAPTKMFFVQAKDATTNAKLLEAENAWTIVQRFD